MCRESAEHPDATAVRRGRKVVAANSWDSIVRRLEAHVLDVLAGKQSRSVASDAA
jgi:hypothetical protein